ncbi:MULTISPECIES: (2Fe-2S)-binding protein [unclassified Streptomyces]|uniref:(2Fe-2S)-binding protein n=1 Tax=Streptomyces sp. NPDC055082 TaxID=3365718 RepID=UPI0037CD7D76
MSNEEHPEHQGHPEGPDPRYGAWQPTPQTGEYDADATAFVHLPPEDLANAPLAAPGHGYVPPMILPLTPAAGLDPAATGSWVVQTQTQQAQAEARAQNETPGAVHWPDPNQQNAHAQQHDLPGQRSAHAQQYDLPGQRNEHAQQGMQAQQGLHAQRDMQAQYDLHAQHEARSRQDLSDQQSEQQDLSRPYMSPYQETSHSTAQWNFSEVTGEPVAEQAGAPDPAPAEPVGHTGQWTIPVADGDLPDESGEFMASAQASQWYAESAPPATLPGGAPAPWATPEPAPEAAETAAEAEHTVPPAESDESHAEYAGGTALGDVPESAPLEETADPVTEEAAEAITEPVNEETTESGIGETAEAFTDSVGETAEAFTDSVGETAEAFTDATAATAEPELAAEAITDVPSEHPAASYLLHVNGVDRPVTDAWIGESLLYVLRERLGLAGAKDGCSQGECGACNVQVDGRLVASCLVPAATAAGSEVRTVEGLAVDGEPSDVQRALAACGAVQCGFCIPGMAMTVHDLLEGNHAPSELETRQALCGNLCRCSGYRGVLDAVAEVVATREASAEAVATTTAHDEDEARIPHQAAPGAGSVQQPHPHEGGGL